MANLLTRKEFAALIKKQPNYVGIYISRKKVIEENKRIDTDHSVNRAFIAKHSGSVDIKESKADNDDKSELTEGNIDYVVRQHDLQLKAVRIAKEKLELEKKKARVIPVDFVIEVFGSYIKTNITGIINDGSKLIDQIIDELEGDYETKLKFKKQFNKMVNETFKTNHENISKQSIDKAKEYAVNRSW